MTYFKGCKSIELLACKKTAWVQAVLFSRAKNNLKLADSIVRQHGGSLNITNFPAKGGGMVTIEF
ncbi:hypothetical protein [Desulfitobacterium sp.]|uniref:hypothetical protein n=1 Tax=Desulfitobacterium sp. TaxID=49981 RepID=UPI002B204282|nr:hypothetical protein [Desulfitobacterium sp.]MEA4902633.1 hypothetical protein [Desulfitobacterium sp.]